MLRIALLLQGVKHLKICMICYAKLCYAMLCYAMCAKVRSDLELTAIKYTFPPSNLSDPLALQLNCTHDLYSMSVKLHTPTKKH